MENHVKTVPLSCLLIDFGGVIAEEGFREGLKAIARAFKLDEDRFYKLASEIVYSCGYVTGKATEHDFWDNVRQKSGISAGDEWLTEEILKRFIPRPGMLRIVKDLRGKGVLSCILSDQTDWLDRLDARYNFFQSFDHVFNSFHFGKSKREISVFSDILSAVLQPAATTLFVDDNVGHIERARQSGLMTHLFVDENSFASLLRNKNLL
jgi:putative hydrolase of the HAD superfamily